MSICLNVVFNLYLFLEIEQNNGIIVNLYYDVLLLFHFLSMLLLKHLNKGE